MSEASAAALAENPQALLDSIYRDAPLSLRPLTPAFGVEVCGVKANETPEWLRRTLLQLWGDYGVLLFRGMDFDEAAQVAFSEMFGESEIHGQVAMNSKTHPQLLYLTNRKDLGLPEHTVMSSELEWHSDQIYLPRPALGSLLYAVQVPDEGGDTYWADLRTAYDRLPEATKRRIEGLRLVVDYSITMKSGNSRATEVQNQRSALIHRHPLVRTHPITLRKALYLSPQTTSHIEGVSAEESRELLAELTEAVLQPDLVYRHKWRVGDALVWDNARVIHKRDSFPADQPRFMKRTTIRTPAEVSIPF